LEQLVQAAGIKQAGVDASSVMASSKLVLMLHLSWHQASWC
jgi:hypothetical protein